MKDFNKGFLLGMLGVTIIGALNDIIINYTELIKGKIGVEIAKYNREINRITDLPTNTRAIGFMPDSSGEEEYND